MTNNYFRVAYPGHWLHGLTPGAPFNNPDGTPNATAFQSFLASGGDPRPYEPMGTTRWGDNTEIILNNAPAATLSAYNTIILMGGVSLDAAPGLQAWAQNGGTLVANLNQISAADYGMFGIQSVFGSNGASSSTWLQDGTQYAEAGFTFPSVAVSTASALATSAGQPFILSNTYGLGRAILTLPSYLQDSGTANLLNVGVRLLDSLQAAQSRVVVSGPAVEYIVNQGSGKTIVTLVNNGASVWNGTVSVSLPEVPAIQDVRDYVTDGLLGSSWAGGVVNVPISVPPFDLRVIAVEYDPSIVVN